MTLPLKLAPQETHDSKRQRSMRDRANQITKNLKGQKGILGVVLSGSAARGPVSASSDLDMHVIVSDEYSGDIPVWTFHNGGIIENLHTLHEDELLCGWNLLDKPDQLAEWFYETKLGDELYQSMPLWWDPATKWQERLATLVEARQKANISQRVARLYNDAVRASIALAQKACDEGAALDGHHQLRLAFQAALTAALVQRGWTIRGSKKRIEIAQAFLPDLTLEELLLNGLEVVGLKGLTSDQDTKICEARLKFRTTLLHELCALRVQFAHDKHVVQKLDQAIKFHEAHEAQAYDYYSPLIQRHILYGPVNHIRCLSGMMGVPHLLLSCLYTDKKAWPISEFIKSDDMSHTIRAEWLKIMDLGFSTEQCSRWSSALSSAVEGHNIESIVLPSDYDISRVKMTETHHQIKKRTISHASKKMRVESFDFLKLRKQTEERIIFFRGKDFAASSSIAEKILRIVTSQKYRAGSLYLISIEQHKDAWLSKLQHHIDKNESVQFMLPAFPFKIRNPLKSSRGGADLAEVASFCKFNEINLQIRKVYNPGAEFHIFHDGHLYYRHFLHAKEDADNYFATLKGFARALQLEKVIILKDAFEELQKFRNFKKIYDEARIEIQNLWDIEKDSNEKILTIRRSSRDNINVSDIDEGALYEIAVHADDELNEGTKRVKTEIARRADFCAFEYMVVQHALERLKFFALSLPNGVRMTVHPKGGQIGIFLVKRTTFLLPWMGVGAIKKNGELSVRYERDVKNNEYFIAVYVGADTSPFYYREC